jgi:hypothetical protein
VVLQDRIGHIWRATSRVGSDSKELSEPSSQRKKVVVKRTEGLGAFRCGYALISETSQNAHPSMKSVSFGAVSRELAPMRRNRQSHHLNGEEVRAKSIVVLGALRSGYILMPEADHNAHPRGDGSNNTVVI